jgi:predicted thioesterase
MDTDHGIFNAMVAQGWTLVAASGDQGVTAGCGDAYRVQYPASDPNIVGAGGTELQLYSNGVFYAETGWTGGPDGCGSNDGGSTGGASAYYAAPSYQTPLGFSVRFVPDIALNADWYHTPQNIYFGGGLSGNGGTSIVAPEMAGFFAQANAYMDYVADVNGGCYGGTTCSPIGNGNWYLYYFGENNTYAPHYPFYDITSGCNNNDVTAYYGLGYYCAGVGYDAVTGWGSINALQLSWAINTYRAGDFAAPTVNFSSDATPYVWYNTDHYVEWTVTDNTGFSGNPVGVAGFTQAWDSAPADSFSLSRPAYADGFFTGPEYPNTTYGYQYVSGAGQGCHETYVRPYDNSGFTNVQTYGPICYDTVAPVTTSSLSGTFSGGVYTTPVKVTLSATDASSGVATTYYTRDGNAYIVYTGVRTIGNTGNHTIYYYSVDKAGNTETVNTRSFTIESPTTTTLTSSLNPAIYGQTVTFTAKVAESFDITPTGTVTFKDGATTLGTGTLSSGSATFSTATLQVGTHSITAVYGGSGNDLTSTSAALSQSVTLAGSSTALASSLNPSIYGQTVVLTATLTSSHGGTVTGTVTFKDGSTTLGTGTVGSGNKATYTTTALLEGTHSLTAVYGGSIDNAGSTSAALTQTVNQSTSTTALASSLNPSVYGQTVTFTATVTSTHGGLVTGTVTFKDGSATLGTSNLNASNQATFATDKLGAATHTITAVYNGSTSDSGSTSGTLSQVVSQAGGGISVTSSLNPSSSGTAVTFTAKITPQHGGAATGTVTFKDGTTTIGTGTVNSTTDEATFTTSTLAVGTHSITADYSGDTNVKAMNSSAISQVVNN